MRPAPVRALWPGAVLGAAAVTVVLNVGAPLLARLVAKAGPVYGSFATVAGMFALLYLVGQALVYAAEVAAVRYARLWPRALDLTRPTAADARALALLAREQERIPAARVQFHLAAQASPPVPGGPPPATMARVTRPPQPRAGQRHGRSDGAGSGTAELPNHEWRRSCSAGARCRPGWNGSTHRADRLRGCRAAAHPRAAGFLSVTVELIKELVGLGRLRRGLPGAGLLVDGRPSGPGSALGVRASAGAWWPFAARPARRSSACRASKVTPPTAIPRPAPARTSRG